MAITNHERVGKALDLLKEELGTFVEREMKAQHAQLWFEQVKASVRETLCLGCSPPSLRHRPTMLKN